MRRETCYSIVTITLVAGAGSVFAADESAVPQGGSSDSLQEVVVTGSRIARPDFVSDYPLVSATAEDLQASAKINVETALEQMPQFQNGQDEGYDAGAAGGGGRATLNLRGLGAQRTLVLVDGRRLPPTDGTGVADLNDVPAGIVDSVQVISGGASAAYGSDAMAGVVNIITKNLDGLEIGVSHGATDGGFGKKNDIYVNGGSGFADNRGHAMISLEYTQRDGVYGSQIPFFIPGGQSTALPYGSYAPTTAPTGFAADPPTQAAINAYFAKYGAPAGAVLNNQILGFNDNGTLFDTKAPYYNYQGLPVGGPGGIISVGGNLVLEIGQFTFITTPEKRYSAFTKESYDLTDNTQLYFQALAVHNVDATQNTYNNIGASSLTTVPITNPFIPADLAALLATRSNPTEPFTFSKRYLDFPPSRWNEYFDADQFLVGGKGKVPSLDFDWDVYYMHDYSLNTEVVHDVVSQVQYNNLLNAPGGGTSLCAGGLNPFQGLHSYISPQCLTYLGIDTHTTTLEGQDTVEASLGGKIISLPAGDARFNLDSEWRQWTSDYSPDSLLVLGNPPSAAGGAFHPTSGSINVHEIAGEVLLPVLKDAALAKSLNLNLAYRYSDYNVSGGASTYKFAADWRPFSTLLFRGGYEHAIRAPNINDLYQAPNSVTVQVGNVPLAGDPCDSRSALRNGPNGAQIAALCVAQGIPQASIGSYTYAVTSAPTIATGSLSVKPEVGGTVTLGAVFSPASSSAAFEHLQLSLDYYRIRISDAIGSSGYLYVITNCYNVNGGNPTYSASNPYCQLINRNANGTPGGSFQIGQPTSNLGGLLTSGIDTELDWSWKLADMGLGSRAGELHLNSTVSWTQHYEVQTVPGVPWTEYAGTIPQPLSPTPPTPKWHALTTLNYRLQPIPVTLGLRWRYIDGMADVSYALNPATTIPGVPSYNYLDLLASWKITKNIDLSGTLTNFTNKAPPIIDATPGITQTQLYDLTGRTYLLSLHAKF